MKTLRQKLGRVCIGICIMALATSPVAFAAYSSLATFSIPSTNTWVNTDTAGNRLMKTKTSNSNNFLVYTDSKTMWTNPQFRIVNSSYEIRSKTVNMAAAGSSKKGELSNAVSGFYYYAQVHRDPLQVGTDSITFKFDPMLLNNTCDLTPLR